MKEGFQDHARLEETMVAVYEGSTVWKVIQEAWSSQAEAERVGMTVEGSKVTL